MNDWLNERTDSRFVFRRVSWPGFEEREELGQIVGGNAELSALSQMKSVATIDFVGREIPDESDMVRIYYSFTGVSGETHTEPIATLFFSVANPTFDGAAWSGSMKCSSVLSVLSDKEYGETFTANAGRNAVELAVELVESLDISANNPDPSAYTLKSDKVFESNESYLDIVNWLLNAAGFSSCWPDAYGVIQMCEYVDPIERPVAFTFSDGDESIMHPEIDPEYDYQSAPNVVRLRYETDKESLWATSRNVDPMSKSSIAFRKREKTYSEDVTELAGETREERLDNLMAMSRRTLEIKSVEVEHVTHTHAWVPISPNDAISVEYETAPFSWGGAIANMAIDFTASIPCQTKSRRFLRKDMKIETEGGVLW